LTAWDNCMKWATFIQMWSRTMWFSIRIVTGPTFSQWYLPQAPTVLLVYLSMTTLM
jgi:hypothetical protein